MVMLTWWLSMARGGTFFSVGMSRPRAWAGAAAASRASKTGNRRRMGNPFLVWARIVLTPSDDRAAGADCPAGRLLHNVTVRPLESRLQAERASPNRVD